MYFIFWKMQWERDGGGGGGPPVNQKHTTSTKTYQYEDDQSMEPKY